VLATIVSVSEFSQSFCHVFSERENGVSAIDVASCEVVLSLDLERTIVASPVDTGGVSDSIGAVSAHRNQSGISSSFCIGFCIEVSSVVSAVSRFISSAVLLSDAVVSSTIMGEDVLGSVSIVSSPRALNFGVESIEDFSSIDGAPCNQSGISPESVETDASSGEVEVDSVDASKMGDAAACVSSECVSADGVAVSCNQSG